MLDQTCKICNDEKPYSRIDVHVKKAHNMSVAEYDAWDTEIVEMDENLIREPISQKEISANIFGDKAVKTGVDLPLKVFLDEFNISEKELRALAGNYSKGKEIPIEQQIEVKIKRGVAEAKTLNHLNVVKTYNLYTAEALEKHYNYECIAVHSAKGNTPKYWELVKR